jgi:hypothetical protein
MSHFLSRYALGALLALGIAATGCAARPEYVVINKSATSVVPKKVILVPFIIDAAAGTGSSNSDLEARGVEARVVVRDELEPYFLDGMRAFMTVADYVPPEFVGGLAALKKLPEDYFVRVNTLLADYAKNSAVNIIDLQGLLAAVDKEADGIIFVRIDKWECYGSGPQISVRGYFFSKDQLKAVWVAQDSTFRASSGAQCDQNGYRSEGQRKLELFVESMPFARRPKR